MFGRKKVEDATAEWPQTVVRKGEGCVHITGRYEQPGLADISTGIYGIGCVFSCILLISQLENQSDTFYMIVPVALIAGMFAIYFYIWRPLVIYLFGKKVDVIIHSDIIQVKKLFGYKNFARDENIEFGVEAHQKGLLEERKETATRKRQPRTYREAIEVVMWYGEKRVVIAEMVDKEVDKAKALVIRLQNWCSAMDRVQDLLRSGEAASVDQSFGDFGPEPDLQ